MDSDNNRKGQMMTMYAICNKQIYPDIVPNMKYHVTKISDGHWFRQGSHRRYLKKGFTFYHEDGQLVDKYRLNSYYE